jgi:hypothetical protein
MKALTGTSWGQDKKTLITTFKTLTRPVLESGAPIWCPNVSDTSLKSLQVVQNSALRITTGCHMKAPIQHLHTETKVLPIVDHLDLKCAQYLASSLRHDSINRDTVLLPQGKRKMKNTLYSKYISMVEPHLRDGVILEANYKRVLKDMHTAAVASSIGRCGPHPVLGCRPPLSWSGKNIYPGPLVVLSLSFVRSIVQDSKLIFFQ